MDFFNFSYKILNIALNLKIKENTKMFLQLKFETKMRENCYIMQKILNDIVLSFSANQRSQRLTPKVFLYIFLHKHFLTGIPTLHCTTYTNRNILQYVCRRIFIFSAHSIKCFIYIEDRMSRK